MGSSEPTAGGASAQLDVNDVLAAVEEQAASDAAARDANGAVPTPESGELGRPSEPETPTHAPDDARTPESQPVIPPAAPPASSTMPAEAETPETPATSATPAQPAGPESVADYLGMDQKALDGLVAALASGQPPSPVAPTQPAAGGPGAPQAPVASSAPPGSPAAAPAQPVDLRFVTDTQIDQLVEEGEIVEAHGTMLKQMAATQRQMDEQYRERMSQADRYVQQAQRQEQAQINTTVGTFFGTMKDLGLDTKYGTGATPTTVEQVQARQHLAGVTEKIWQALGGQVDTLDQALKLAIYTTDRQAVEGSIASRARTGVRQSLQRRQGVTDVTPGGSTGPNAPQNADPDRAALELAGSFIDAQRHAG